MGKTHCNPQGAAREKNQPAAKARTAAEGHSGAGAGTPPLSSGGTSLLQARTVNEVVKAQLNKVELAHRKGNWWIGRRPWPTCSNLRASSATRG